MNKNTTEHHLKKECDLLAELLHSHEDYAQILPGLFRLSLLQSKQLKTTVESSPSASQSTDIKTKIGIWEADSHGDNPAFIRDPNTDPLEAGMWAECERIPPKSNKTRIVLLGESVARGFFFEPHFSPASVMECILNKTASHEYEVIDLARSDLSLDGLKQILHKSLMLKPDHIVIFSGNNWLAYGNAVSSQTQALAETIKSGHTLAEYTQHIKTTVCNQMDDLLQQCQHIQTRHHFPVTFILPEFNLADFHSNTRYASPFMESQKSSQWRRVLHQTETLDQAKGFQDIKQNVEKLSQLDDKTSSLPFALAAQSALQNNDLESARNYFEKAKDAEMWHCLTTPRCFTFIIKHMRNRMNDLGLQLVDLPNMFQQLDSQKLPGRELFFDYCHLTEKGIQTAMSAAAQSVIKSTTKENLSFEDILYHAPTVPKPLKARAHLLAASHNASWGQPKEIIFYHCQQSYTENPDVYRKLNQWSQIAGTPVSSYLTKPFHQAWKTGDLVLLHKLATLGPYLYKDFVQSYEKILKTNNHEDSPSKIYDTHHDVATQNIDLLQTQYSIRSWAQPEAFNRKDLGFFRSYSMISHFELYCSINRSIQIEITVRIPFSKSVLEPLRIECNQQLCLKTEVTKNWQRFNFTINKKTVHPGINTISIIWPINHHDITPEINRVKKRFLEGQKVQFYIPSGDIYFFHAYAI